MKCAHCGYDPKIQGWDLKTLEEPLGSGLRISLIRSRKGNPEDGGTIAIDVVVHVTGLVQEQLNERVKPHEASLKGTLLPLDALLTKLLQ